MNSCGWRAKHTNALQTQSYEAVVISGMGDPFTHPEIYALIEAVKSRGLSLTIITNLIPADPERILIGDDEHGWSDRGTFNFEGGCYAKTINLDPEAEPEIYATTSKFGTVIENMVYDGNRPVGCG